MIKKNLIPLKTFIKNKTTENNTCTNLVIENHMLKQLLKCILLLKSHFNFILNRRFQTEELL